MKKTMLILALFGVTIFGTTACGADSKKTEEHSGDHDHEKGTHNEDSAHHEGDGHVHDHDSTHHEGDGHNH